MSKSILITGGSGFIARSAYEFLSNAYFTPLTRNVYSVTRQDLDILDENEVASFLEFHKFDVIINGATYDPVPDFSTKDPTRTLEMNLKMFFNIVRCKDHFGKMIHFGTGAEFGSENWKPLMKESFYYDNIPTKQYDLAKHIMTQYTYQLDNVYNLRLFGLYGKFDDWRYRFISNACCKAALDLDITIKNNRRIDYLHIDDLMLAVKWIIENDPPNKVYNVCTSSCKPYNEIAQQIVDISKKDIDIKYTESDHWSDKLDAEYSGDNTLMKTDMKFVPKPVDYYLPKLYNWYSDNKNNIDPNLFLY